MESFLGRKCECDACDVVQTPGTPWTADGYCAHCDAACYPRVEIGGGESECATTRFVNAGRFDLHPRHAHAAPPLAPPPTAGPVRRAAGVLAATAPPGSALGDLARTAVHVLDVAQAAGVPLVNPALAKALGRLFGRGRGRGK